jgi:excisionase family DNA binding protein
MVEMGRTSILGGATRVEPGPEDRTSATGLERAVAGADRMTLRLPDGREFELPAALVRILQASTAEIAAGHTVTILVSDVKLTPAEVGNLLGLSRPYVARLLDQGQLPSEYLPDSRHRVVRLEDVLEFQARRERRSEGRQRIAEAVEDADLPY